MLPIVTSWLPSAMGISSAGLIDHFDPAVGLETDGDGQVVSWTNQADGARGTSGGSTVTVIADDGIPPLVRFFNGINSGALAYPSPGTEALSDGYAVFVVFRLNERIAVGNPFPRLWRGANDTHALFLRQSSRNMEVKSDPLGVALRPKSNYEAEYDLGEIAILTAWLTPTRQELYFNGRLVDSSKAVIGTYEIDGAVFEIGNSVRGDIGDVLVYDSSATLADLNQSGSALAEKYGVNWKDIRPALIAVAENGLVDLFDPAFELSLNDNGEVAEWTNIADSSRSSGGSAHASRVEGPAGRPLIRFNSPEGSGHLSYPAPASTLTEGYTVFVVVRLNTRLLESWPAFPRLWRGANDAHALFLRRSNGNVEVKADPLDPALRPQRNYASQYSEHQIAILTARLTPTSQELYFNGRLVGSSNAVIGAYELDQAVFEIGNSVRGDIGHVLVYDATATLADLDVTGLALASAYATDWTRIAQPEPGRMPAMSRVAAHRGNSSEAPENTLASIAAAVGLTRMVEFDTQVAADGTIVLMHDSTVDRTTNGTGSVDEMPYENGLDELDAGSWFDPSFAGEPVPTLAEALTLAFDEGLVPIMEAKLPGPGDAIVYFEELERLDALDKVMLDSFDWGFLANFRQLSPQTKLGVLGSGHISQGLIDEIKGLGADYLHWAHGFITQQEVDRVHANGLELILWTVNNEARMHEFLELGVDAITTDFPRVLDAVLRVNARRSYSTWILDAHDLPPEARGFHDDPSGDGVANGLKYLFGADPMVPGRMPVMSVDEGGTLSLHHSRNPSAIDASLSYEWSSDLQHWHGSGEPDESGMRVDLLPTVSRKRAFPENDDIRVTAEVTGTLSRLFLRVRATQD